MKKKILSVLLTLAMILSMAASFAGTVTAAVADADLTIHDYAGLEAFISSLATDDYAGKTVALGADITVNDGWVANDGTSKAVTAPTGDNAKILDTTVATKSFAGTFDGDRHTIKGLYMSGCAFFPATAGATIQNVTFDNCSATPTAYASGKNCAGIVVGRLVSGSLTLNTVVVKNSKIVNGTVAGYMGSLVGRTETTTGTILIEKCKSIDCNLYSGASTSLVGGIVGCLNGAGSANVLNCYSSTEISVSGGANAGYKCGGIIGSSGGVVHITDCENAGNITSQSHAGGIVGDVGGGTAFIANCINRGDMVVKATSSKEGMAGGMIGRTNNAYGTTISGSTNFGNVTVTTVGTSTTICAGGMIGFCQNKTDNRDPVTILQSLNRGEIFSNVYAGGVLGYLAYGELKVSDFVNMESVSSNYDAGGVIGDAIKHTTHKTILSLTNFVNMGDITASYKAGGVVGTYQGLSGIIDKVITVGTIKAYNDKEKTPVADLIAAATKINTGAGCAVFGSWGQANGTDEVELIDFFYSNPAVEGGVDNVFGLWQNLGTTYNNHKASYTATDKSLDFVPGTTNTDSSLSKYDNTQSKNLDAYNKFFVENGYAADPTEFYAENGANTFKAFNLGVDWMLTDTVPVPAGVFALLEEKELTEGEIDYVGYQASIGSLSSIRVIAGLNGIDYANTGFELYLIKAGEQATMADLNTTTVYTAINVYDENGNAQDPFLASEAGYQYLSAITVTCTADQMGDATTLIVKPYVTVDGEKTYGDACAIVIEKNNGALVIADQYVM